MKLTVDRLRQALHYDPLTGLWVWLISTSGRFGQVGSPAGCARPTDGRRCISIDGKKYLASRLAWFYMTGEWPVNLVDHENADHTDDRWANLRVADYSQNAANQRRRPCNTSGFKGVNAPLTRLQSNKFRAQIRCNGKRYHLGYFPTAEAAGEAYIAGARKLFGDFARDR